MPLMLVPGNYNLEGCRFIQFQGGTDQEGSDTDEDESSSPRADSSSGDEDEEEEDIFYDASEMARSSSLQASRSGSLSLPAFEGEGTGGDRCV